MKRQLKISALLLNFFLALVISVPVFGADGLSVALGIVAISTAVQYFAPGFYQGKLMEGLQTEVWIAGIREQPIPDTSFVMQSTDMSEYVENNTLHLAEAGVDPQVYEDYFANNEDPLPLQDISDIPHEVGLKTYSTAQTRHRSLQEIELQYNKKQSVIGRHRKSLSQNLGARAAFSWSPVTNDEYNKIMKLADGDSFIDAMIDQEAFFSDLDKTDNMNINISAAHMALIKKEDKKLYKEILNERTMYGMRVYRYSKGPLYTAEGVKKPYGSLAEAGDTKASFIWQNDEVFRCFGDVEMYENLRDSGVQADTLSFAQRALVGKIRASNPKYLGAII